MNTAIEWMRWMHAAASPELVEGLREGRIVLGTAPLLEILRKQAPDDVTVESIELEPPARVVVRATSRSGVTLRVVLPIDFHALRWSQAEATVTYALARDAAEIDGEGLIASLVLTIGIVLARLRGSDGATILDERLATALKAEAVPDGRRVDLRRIPEVARELDRTVGGIALWSIVTFDRVECTSTSIVMHVSPETKARAAKWKANAETAVAASKKAMEVFNANEGDLKKTTKDLLPLALNEATRIAKDGDVQKAAMDLLGSAFDKWKSRKSGAS
jgi:hypothetical protein